MECERKINLGEGVPLNTECSTNIILNTGQGKLNSPSAAVIQLKSNEKTPHDVGLHINTTLSISSSKKVRFLFMSSLVMSAVCIVVTTSVALYYWHELVSLRLQINEVQERLITSSLKNQLSRALDPVPSAQGQTWNDRQARQDISTFDSPPPGRHFYVDGLEEDLHFAPGSKRRKTEEKKTDVTVIEKQYPVIAHFIGAGLEKNMGIDPYVGPWQADYNSSSEGFAERLELVEYKFVKVHEGGLYLVYAQLMYVSNKANYFLLWAQRQEGAAPPQRPRLLSTCAGADVSAQRPLRNSQISCSIQTVARLSKGDLINFSQRERNSTVYLHPGASYFGFIKLGS